MGKILKSLSLVLAVAAIAGYGTYSYFSDTEASTGNTFTAGSIDLTLGGDFKSANNGNKQTSFVASDGSTALYDFTDLKPGDQGDGAFNLSVTTNDAYVCAKSTITSTPENGINDPEKKAGDVTDGDNGGELQNYLRFATYADLDDSGTYSDGDPVNVGQYNAVPTYNGITVADLGAAGWVPVAQSVDYPNSWLVLQNLPHGVVKKAGLLYCFGNFKTDGTGANTKVTGCDGTDDGLQNRAQTDKVIGGIEFYAVQARNNNNFTCSSMNTVVYDALPSVSPATSYPSQPFQAQQTFEFGDSIHLGETNRKLDKVTVTMVTWAKFADYSANSLYMNNSVNWTHPITLNIYSTSLDVNGVPNNLLGTVTKNITIPWRPVADSSCPDTGYGAGVAWRDANGVCRNGLAFNAIFDMSSLNVTLPNDIIVSIAYNTQSYGTNPIGVDGPYNSLNVAVPNNQPVIIGSDASVSEVFWNTITANWYADHGAAGFGIFRKDTNWTPNGTVALRIEAKQ